jgi:Flp pilus assembly protein TadG
MMTSILKKLRLVRKDQDGATILEFALVAPVFVFMLLGTFEIGYGVYMRSALNGAIQQAARAATLENANDPAVRRATDNQVRNILKRINGSLTDSDIRITRKSYLNFSTVERMETYTDSNSNGRCDNNEVFIDENGNGTWGTVGRADNGGARDAVLYTISVTYDSVFPFTTFTRNSENRDAAFTLRGLDNQRTLTSNTLLKNQPFGDQAARGAGSNANCDGTDDTDDDADFEEDYDGATEG